MKDQTAEQIFIPRISNQCCNPESYNLKEHDIATVSPESTSVRRQDI